MAFRRTSRRSFSSFRPRRRRSALNWQKADRPRKWQMGNLFTTLNQNVPNTSDTTVNTAILLARTQNLGETTTGPGRAMAEMTRRVEIGGVVLSFGYFNPDLDLSLDPKVESAYMQYTLAVDRLDVSGAPAAMANVAWQRNTLPALQVTAALPGTSEEDVDFPTRILWRQTQLEDGSRVNGTNSLAGLQFLQNIGTRPMSSHLNKRLRLPLDDEHGLFFCFSSIKAADYAGGVAKIIRLWLTGSIYYRVVLGR